MTNEKPVPVQAQPSTSSIYERTQRALSRLQSLGYTSTSSYNLRRPFEGPPRTGKASQRVIK
jgi:hypothetical protein